MTQNDFSKIVDVLKGYYPQMQLGTDANVSKVWLESFARYDGKSVLNAVKMYGEHNKYAPSVSDIKELIKDNIKIQVNGNNCPYCSGRGYVTVRIRNEETNRLYNGNDWANEYAVTCEHCHGWYYDPDAPKEERRVIRK